MPYDVLSFHPGRQHNFEQAAQLCRHFNYFKHVTSLYFEPKIIRRIEHIYPKMASVLKKRTSVMSGSVVDTKSRYALKLHVKQKLFGNDSIGLIDYYKKNAAFQKWLIGQYAPPKVCLGFDSSSWIVFREWKNRSFLVLDLSTINLVYKQKLVEQYQLDPDLAERIIKDDPVFYSSNKEELMLADLILCPSEFSKRSCIETGVPAHKITVLPYGVDLQKFDHGSNKKDSAVTRVVFIGRVSFSKGADVLLDAWKELNEIVNAGTLNAELHLYGAIHMPVDESLPNVIFHHHISQDALASELRSAHIAVLPTLFEGSSLSVYQSMAMGLAVITTPNAGSIIEHHKTGLIVDYGDRTGLVKSLLYLINNPVSRDQLAAAGQQEVMNYSWDSYGVKLAKIIRTRVAL